MTGCSYGLSEGFVLLLLHLLLLMMIDNNELLRVAAASWKLEIASPQILVYGTRFSTRNALDGIRG